MCACELESESSVNINSFFLLEWVPTQENWETTQEFRSLCLENLERLRRRNAHREECRDFHMTEQHKPLVQLNLKNLSTKLMEHWKTELPI